MDGTAVGILIGILLIAITLILIFFGNKKGTAPAAASTGSSKAAASTDGQTARAPQAVAPVAAPTAVAQAKPDDLVIIEGIGPKIAGILKAQGITTFAQLASTDVAALEKLLKANGLQFAKPGSWPEQARLASLGKMDELKALQDKLNAGR